MAYAALVSLAQTLDRRQHPYPEMQQIQSLHERIVLLTTFLDDFPTEAGRFETRITVAVNQAEDIFEYHILRINGPKYGKRRSRVLNWFQEVLLSPPIHVFSGLRLYKQLRKPINEMDSILEEVMQIKSSCTKSTHASLASEPALTMKNTVVGFEEDLMKIKGRLYGEPCKLQVIPIVGMGGIGKTTLARYALDDPSSMHHFDVRAWVTVSQNHSVPSILLDLLNSIDPSIKEDDPSIKVDICADSYIYMGGEYLVERVFKYLKRRRYLIVIDDIWNADVWDGVRRVFPDDLNGSRIIITTRDLDVVSYVDSLHNPHRMHLMNVEQSWNLLRHKVFAEEHCPPELVEIGNLIAKNCGGLPLAVVVIAGVLSKVSRIQETWTAIARDVIEAVDTSDEPFAEILLLSYTRLPHYLRPCFLYMGGFPEYRDINVSKLVKLWAAEGFLKSNGSKDIEEVAEDYLDDLAKRSLVLVNKKRYNGKIKTVKMHDLLRDLCLKRARDEKFLNVIYKFSGSFPEGVENTRRLSISSNILGRFLNMDDSRIHTILVLRHWAFDSCKGFRLLRVLDAISARLPLYPFEIGELFHLRYLAVKFEPSRKRMFHKVPDSWSKLQNLQTLIISNSFGLISRLPFGIWRIPQLRHVIMSDGCFPDPFAKFCHQVLALENLHTLTGLNGYTFCERISELVPNLKKLGLVYSYDDIYGREWSEFGLNNLIHLHKLEKLNFRTSPHDYVEHNLSKSLAFPVTLKKLTLTGSEFPWEDMSIVGSLPNLQVLKLKRHACRGLEWETTEGEFCQLRQLLIDSTDPHQWRTESSHFPRLERLLLRNCHTLEEIPFSIGEIPTLQLIEVSLCNSSIVDSAKRIEEEQDSFGNDLQVHLTTSSDRDLDMAPTLIS